MRALSLTQPWAGLVASGIKRIENRSRQFIKLADFGKPFAIHATLQIDHPVYEQIHEIAPELVDIQMNGKLSHWHYLSKFTGCVVGVATIERVVVHQVDGQARDPNRVWEVVDLGDQARWFFGPIGYVLRDIRSLPLPVPCKGHLGFWKLSFQLEKQVMEQLA